MVLKGQDGMVMDACGRMNRGKNDKEREYKRQKKHGLSEGITFEER